MLAKIQKVINNNIIIVIDQNGNEMVAMGRGLGFNQKPDTHIPIASFEKTFILSEKDLNKKLHQLVSVLPPKHFVLSEKIIDTIKTLSNWQISDNIYITLTDHISGAINRYKKNIVVENPLRWDIKHLYPEEYFLGRKALDIIYQDLGVNFNEDEAASIALHLVNARINTDENMELVHKVTKLIREVTNIVKYHFRMEQPPDSLEYYQLVTYVKAIAPQIIAKTKHDNPFDELFDVIYTHYKPVYDCMVKIQRYLKEQYCYSANGEEMLFITMCLSKIKNKLSEQ